MEDWAEAVDRLRIEERLHSIHVINAAVAAGMGSKEAGRELERMQRDYLNKLNGR